MAATTTQPTTAPGPLVVSSRIKTVSAVFAFLGLVSFIGLLFVNKERAWHAYLTGYFYFTSLALGGLFFTAIQHLVKAGWSVNIRRFSESMTSFLPVAFIGGLVLLFGAPSLYLWMDSSAVASDYLLQHKVGYLNFPFFVIRVLVFFAVWIFFWKKIVGGSVKQDETGDEEISNKLTGFAVGFTLFFAITYSFFSLDLMMTLEPHWFSTIFGVYAFAGLFQSSLAFLVLLVIYCMKKGLLKGFVDENHLHDLGKFLFAFTVFWAYIAYSQFMLIWYANLPEETMFFLHRMHGGWIWVSLSLIVFKFVVPFLALLPQRAKRNPNYLAAVAVLILIMQYVDFYWIVYPNLDDQQVILNVPEILVWLGFGGVFLMTTF
ncbi:MAG: molybdopterin oxidoreductase, partial [Bdellovibrionales bacterium]|nr:molybdopterin oxidoreductase [Bdellovibrionales bacterium]